MKNGWNENFQFTLLTIHYGQQQNNLTDELKKRQYTCN